MTIPKKPLRILILGAGFSGLGAAVRLKQQGFDDITIVDRGQQVGGTWRDNTYPGCACDVRSHLYSFSFAPHFDWDRPYATQPQILAYLNHIADTFGLRPHLRLGEEVTLSEWDDATHRWRMHLASGEVLEGDVLLSGVGGLVNPSTPDLPGLADFAGEVIHSARWRHDVELAGRRVAMIGTGASAVQIAPQLAPSTEHLSVFQRTAPWVTPRPDEPYGRVKRALWRHVPGALRANRWRIWLFNEVVGSGLVGNRLVARAIAYVAKRQLTRQVRDRALAARLTPDHVPGCKRILVSDTWYPTLQRPDVSLVSSPIERVVAGGIVTRDGQLHRADAIVMATGFVVTEFKALTHTRGRDGLDLGRLWMKSAQTHLGVAVHGFPNFFVLLGPGSAIGSNSIVFMLESQLNYIVQAVIHLATTGRAIELRADVQAQSHAQAQQRLKRTVWATGCHNYFQAADGRNDAVWPDLPAKYWMRTRKFDPSVYDTHPVPPPNIALTPA